MSDEIVTPVLVTGDQTIDWAIMQDAEPRWHGDERFLPTDMYWQPGGAFLLQALIGKALGDSSNSSGQPTEKDLKPYLNPFNHSYAALANYDGKHRIKEYFGFRQSRRSATSQTNQKRVATDGPGPGVVVADDAGLGFRSDPKNWSSIIPDSTAENGPWVLIKMSNNILDGGFWEYISDRLSQPGDWLRKKLVVLTSVTRLREREVQISRDLSWERSALDVVNQIRNAVPLKGLNSCHRIIVSFGPSGVLLIDNSVDQYRLCFNPELLEGQWARKHSDGMMFGYGSVLCAEVCRELAESSPPDLPQAARNGLAAMQRVYDYGFDLEGRRLKFPDHALAVEAVSSASHAKAEDYSQIDIPAEWIHPDSAARYPYPAFSGIRHSKPGDLEVVAANVAMVGKEALPEVPIGIFGKLVTVERREIESLHAIRNLVHNYSSEISLGTDPLAIAVFGSPGSGKSYAVEQAVSGLDNIDVLKFNLSQFDSPKELIGALHRVRDSAFKGKIPLVFWDEFDSVLDGQPLGWLRYFLAPIQDGHFQQGEIDHPVGASIFVFAGGTSKRFEAFRRRAESKVGRNSKALDFLSRLRGYIDIIGPDPVNGNAKDDPQYVLRRALILHGLFAKKGLAKSNGAYRVDRGVLHGFLEVPKFNHGVRSMAAIIEMSRLRKGDVFTRSSLPVRAQLNLHVNGRAFLDLVGGQAG